MGQKPGFLHWQTWTLSNFPYQWFRVISATSDDELKGVKREAGVLITAGWLQDLTLENKELAIQTLMVHFILERGKEPLSQFCKGLNTLGILELVRSHPKLMRRYFVQIGEPPFQSEDIIGLLVSLTYFSAPWWEVFTCLWIPTPGYQKFGERWFYLTALSVQYACTVKSRCCDEHDANYQ